MSEIALRMIFLLMLCLIASLAVPQELRAEEGCDICFDPVQNWLIIGYTEYNPTVDGDYSLFLKVTDKAGALIPAADIQGLTNNPELVASDAMGPNLGLCFDSGTERTAYFIYSNTSGIALLAIPEVAPSGPPCTPILSVSPLSIAFGTVNIGNTPTSPISVCNTGDCDLTIESISTPAAPFSIASNTCTSTLASGNCCTVTVRFAPVSEGSFTSSVNIDTNGGNSTVALSGTGQNISAGYSISGTVTYLSTGLAGVNMILTGPVTTTAMTDTNGSYSFTNLPNGTYMIQPRRTGYRFTPSSRSVTINGSNITGEDFSAMKIR